MKKRLLRCWPLRRERDFLEELAAGYSNRSPVEVLSRYLPELVTADTVTPRPLGRPFTCAVFMARRRGLRVFEKTPDHTTPVLLAQVLLTTVPAFNAGGILLQDDLMFWLEALQERLPEGSETETLEALHVKIAEHLKLERQRIEQLR